MIVNEVRFDDRVIELSSTNVNSEINAFTIVVGRNGSGKSRLLQKICQLFIVSMANDAEHFRGIQDLLDYSERREAHILDESGSLTYSRESIAHKILIEKRIFSPNNPNLSQIPEHLHQQVLNSLRDQHYLNSGLSIRHMENDVEQEKPTEYPKIIAVSSSPFDKYPILNERLYRHDRETLKSNYFYRGARTKDRSGKTYLRSKFDQLGASFINLFLKTNSQTIDILPLLSYLGVEKKFTVYLKFPDHFSIFDITSEEGRGPLETVETVRFFKGKEPEASLTEDEKKLIIKSAVTIRDGLLPNQSEKDFHRRDDVFSLELEAGSNGPQYLAEFAILAEYDLLDLANIEFTKTAGVGKLLLTDASSGELCILFNVLAIAGLISDDSIVLLDEPELSLHPEWQREFLPLMKNIFLNYKRCHFIIATHSPHFLSSVSQNNSFVVNLEDNPAIATTAENHVRQSSDYQLAVTFQSPGFKNQYLISQIVETLSKLSEGKKLDREFLQQIEVLLNYRDLVPEDDPVKRLLATLKKAVLVLADE